jgi:hypothetical protein
MGCRAGNNLGQKNGALNKFEEQLVLAAFCVVS